MELRLGASEESAEARLCISCKKERSKYCCPKCRAPYCSLACYKAHSNQCVELFYQQNVMEHLKSTAGSDKDKLEMMRILKKMQQEAENEECAAEAPGDERSNVQWEEVLERLERGEDVLASLPADVRADFERAVKEGTLGAELEVWEPWWNSVARLTPIPITVPSLPPLATLTRAPPSPLLAYGVADLLFTYAVVMRLWQGDWKDDAPSAAAAALQLSAVLSAKQPHASTRAAMQCVTERAVRFKLLPSATAVQAMGEVPKLLARHDYALAALADLHALFTHVMRLSSGTPVKVVAEERKLFFHLVYLNELPPAMLAVLGREAAEAHAEQLKLQASALRP